MPTADPAFNAAYVASHIRSLTASGRGLDATAAAAHCTTDVLFDDAGGTRRTGRDAIAELFGSIFSIMESFDITLEGTPVVQAETSRAAARFRIRARTKAGHEFELETVDLYRFSDGLIAEYTIFVRDQDWLDRLS